MPLESKVLKLRCLRKSSLDKAYSAEETFAVVGIA